MRRWVSASHRIETGAFGFSQLDFILDGSHVWILPHRKIIPKYGCLLIFLQIYLETVLGLPVRATIFAGLEGLHIRHGGAGLMTDRQVALLRQRRMEGKTQETAAAMAGMSVRSARKLQRGRYRLRPRQSAGGAPGPTLSRACGRRRLSPCCGRSRGQAEGNYNYRVAGRA